MINMNSDKDEILNGIQKPVLKVIGLGGGGCNAVERMMENNIKGIEFITANTDFQVLKTYSSSIKIQLGPRLTRGLGAGGDPRVGKAAAEESEEEIKQALKGADIVFLTAGMGGGTGTGSIPVVAKIARELGAVVIAIITTPFSFEMGKRQKNARLGLDELRQFTNTLVTIPNDKLIQVSPRYLPMETAFRLADDVLRQAVQAISEVINEPGLINVDFAHINQMMHLGGGTLMSIGHGNGFDKVQQALYQALHHPLLDDIDISNAKGIIANFTGGEDLTLAEVEFALTQLNSLTGPQTDVVLGVIQNPEMKERVQVILMVTGIDTPTLESIMGVTVNKQKIINPEQQSEKEVVHPSQNHSYPEILREQNYPVLIKEEENILTSGMDLDVPTFLRKRARIVVAN